jgi:hypothetical protein
MLQQGSDERKRLYWVWADMLGRCRNPRHKAFHNYGGRGVRVCPRWERFECFLADMSPRPQGALLDRTNNNGDYEPSNCRWATRKEQNSNRRNCVYVDEGGSLLTVRELCRRRGLPYRPIMKRRARGWPLEQALAVPVGSVHRRPM